MQQVEFEFDDDVIGKVIEFFPENVLDVAREESAELIQAICKVCRYGMSPLKMANLVEEMADTLIVIRELQKFFDIPEEDLQEVIKSKQIRTKERIRKLGVDK